MLTNGNSGRIQIPIVYENATVVPQEATYEQQGNIMIFKLEENNKVTSSIIKIKANVDNLYVVESGLESNAKIVTTGVGKLKSGMEITPKEIPFEEVTKPITTLFKN